MILTLLPSLALAKGGISGGRSFSSSRSTSSSFKSSSSIKPSTSVSPSTSFKSTASTPALKPSLPKITTKPSFSTVKVTSPVAKTVNGKSFGKTGSIVSSTYQPKFKNGYTAPIGSTVYYQDTSSSLMNWLPFYMIMTSQSHRDVIVTEPAKDGQPAKETIIKEEGVDTMYIINWIFSILIIIGLIILIVYQVNKKTKNA